MEVSLQITVLTIFSIVVLILSLSYMFIEKVKEIKKE
jgi:hypothetical protein